MNYLLIAAVFAIIMQTAHAQLFDNLEEYPEELEERGLFDSAADVLGNAAGRIGVAASVVGKSAGGAIRDYGRLFQQGFGTIAKDTVHVGQDAAGGAARVIGGVFRDMMDDD